MKHIKPSILIAVLLIIILSIAATYAFAQGEVPTYYACVNNASGTIFVVDQDTSCKTNESRIEWNRAGPPGPQGPAGPSGVSEAWWADICSSYGCEEPLIVYPDTGYHDVWYIDLPSGLYVFNASIGAVPPLEYDDDGNQIGRVPGGFLDCSYFSGASDGSGIDLTGIQTGNLGGDVTDLDAFFQTHKLNLQEDTHFLLSCKYDIGTVDPSLPDRAIEILASEFTAIKVDQIHQP